MQLEFDPAEFSATPEGTECLHVLFVFLGALERLSFDCIYMEWGGGRMLLTSLLEISLSLEMTMP